MAVVIASELGKDIAGSPLLRDVSFKLERRDRMTLSGRNGSGKTTLLRMLAGQAGIDRGKLSLQKSARVSLHDQRPPRERGLSLRDYVLSGAEEVTALEAELTRLEQAMADGAHDEATLAAYSKAQERFELHGGYRWRDRALVTMRGLGFHEDDLDRSLSTFSGGELTRGSLARALTGEPDLLLLDEPTNHLDIASLEWLEEHLTGLDAAIVLVAHDRWFLEAVGTSVLELEAGRSRFFAGPWHAWRKEQAARELALGRAIDRQQAEIARLERFVERFRAKASKARQAQSRVKRLEKMDRVERDPRDTRELSFAFKAPERSGRVVFELENGRIEVPGRTLLENASLWVERGEHVTLVGGNGSGKTTLIETLTGSRELPAGKLRKGHKVNVGYVSQHAEELTGGGTVLDAAQRATGLTPGQGAGAARPVPVLAATRCRSRSTACPAASCGGSRWPCSCTPTRTCWCSTSPPTTSTSRAARRSRTRSRRSRARCCWCPTTAPCSTPSAAARSRSRTARCTPTRAAGPSTCRRARSARRPSASRPRPSPRRSSGRAATRGRRRTRSGRSRRWSADREGRSRAPGARGGAGRPRRVGQPRALRRVERAPRRRQARAGGALRAAGEDRSENPLTG